MDLDDLGISVSLRETCEKYEKFFNSTKRIEKLSKLNIKDYTEETLELGMIASLCGSKTIDIEEIFRNIFIKSIDEYGYICEDEDNKLIILSKNKNLFDENQTPVEQSDLGNWVRTFYPKPNTEYIYSSSPYTGHVTIKFYDINDKVISGISIPSNTTFVTPSDCKYAKTHTDNNSLVQIEFGNRKTEYVPHKSHKTEILLKEPLREGDYIEGKKIYRNVKQDGLTLIPLEEPIIEELPNSITLQGFDDTTMYIENTITPTVSYGYNALIPYKQELLNQKEEVETNTLDIEQNIIPYLMDMEYNLMLMEDN